MSRLVAVLGGVSLCVSACGGSPTQPAPVQSSTVQAVFLVPAAPDLPVGGGESTIDVVTAASQTGGIAPNVTVTLEASAGTLSTTSVHTNAEGRATVTWHGTETAVISATAGEVRGTATVRVALPPVIPPPTPQPPQPPQPPAPPQQPIAAFLVLSPAALIDTVTPLTFSATVFSQDGKPLGPLTYQWDFGDGGTSTEARPVHTYRVAQTYTVAVTITEPSSGRQTTPTARVFVDVAPPPAVVVSLGGTPNPVDHGTPITFVATAQPNSTAGTIVSYAWDFGVNGAIDQVTTVPTTTVSYEVPTVRTVRVTVTTSAGTVGTASLTVTIQ